MAVAGHAGVVRHQGTDVAGPYLAARRARPGADLRLGHPGRHPAEDGRLRLSPVLAPHAARSLALFRAADFLLKPHGHHLYLAGGADAARYEKTDCL